MRLDGMNGHREFVELDCFVSRLDSTDQVGFVRPNLPESARHPHVTIGVSDRNLSIDKDVRMILAPRRQKSAP
jgi:hypothetical protein